MSEKSEVLFQWPYNSRTTADLCLERWSSVYSLQTLITFVLQGWLGEANASRELCSNSGAVCVLCRAAAEDTKMGIQLGELCACTFKGFVLSQGYASAVLGWTKGTEAAATGQAVPAQDALASASQQVGLGAGRPGCARDGRERKAPLRLVSCT